METVIRKVVDIDPGDRRALEHMLGRSLGEHQKLVIRVLNFDAESEVETLIDQSSQEPRLPSWCRVFEGLTDKEVHDIEQTILRRADLTRSTD